MVDETANQCQTISLHLMEYKRLVTLLRFKFTCTPLCITLLKSLPYLRSMTIGQVRPKIPSMQHVYTPTRLKEYPNISSMIPRIDSPNHTTRPLTCLMFLMLISRQNDAAIKATANMQMLVVNMSFCESAYACAIPCLSDDPHSYDSCVGSEA